MELLYKVCVAGWLSQCDASLEIFGSSPSYLEFFAPRRIEMRVGREASAKWAGPS